MTSRAPRPAIIPGKSGDYEIRRKSVVIDQSTTNRVKMNINELIAQKRAEAKNILETARADGRENLTRAEDRRFTGVMSSVEYLEEVKAVGDDFDQRMQNATRPEGLPDPSGNSATVDASTGKRTSLTVTEDNSPWKYRSNDQVATVARDQRYGDHEVVKAETERNSERDRLVMGTHGDFGQMLRNMSTTGASAIVPTVWSNNIIDLARNKAVMFQAGANLVPMNAKVVQIGRLTGDATPAFRTEGSTITESDLTFDFVQLTARSLNALVVVSEEFLMDAIDATAQVEMSIAKAIALELDKAIMFGQLAAGDEPEAGALASPYPMGILESLVTNAPGNILGASTNGTAQTTATPWNELVQLVYKVRRNNERVTAMVSNDALAEQYDLMYDTLGQPLRKPGVLSEQPWLTTNAIPSFTAGTMTSVATDVFAGDFSQVLVGHRAGLTVRILRERYAEIGSVGIVASWRGDVQLARPNALACYRYLQGAA